MADIVTITVEEITENVTITVTESGGGSAPDTPPATNVNYANVLLLNNYKGTFYNAISGTVTFTENPNALVGATDRLLIISDGTTPFATQSNLESVFVEGLGDLPNDYILTVGTWAFYFLKTPEGVALNHREFLGIMPPVPDTTPPVITLNGSATINHPLGTSYTDAGATATDNVDGDITANIVVGGDTVNTSVEAAYVITYNVSDAAGNAATEVTRTVTVVDQADVTPPATPIITNVTLV